MWHEHTDALSLYNVGKSLGTRLYTDRPLEPAVIWIFFNDLTPNKATMVTEF